MCRLESEMFLVDCVVCSDMPYWINPGDFISFSQASAFIMRCTPVSLCNGVIPLVTDIKGWPCAQAKGAGSSGTQVAPRWPFSSSPAGYLAPLSFPVKCLIPGYGFSLDSLTLFGGSTQLPSESYLMSVQRSIDVVVGTLDLSASIKTLTQLWRTRQCRCFGGRVELLSMVSRGSWVVERACFPRDGKLENLGIGRR